MPSTQSRPVVVLLALTACLSVVAVGVVVPAVAGGSAAAGAAGAYGAAGTSTTGHPAASTGCFPGVDAVERGEAVGDVVDIEMLLCFEGSVTVEGPGYRGTANLSGGDKSGQVTLAFNTHREDGAAIDATSDTFDLRTNASGNGSFEPGNYTVTVRDGSGDVRDEVSVAVGEPRAQDLRLWRAPRGAASDLRTVEAVERSREAVARVDSRRRLEDPDYADSLPVATNETLVMAIEAGGLEGAMAAAEGSPLARFRTAIRETNATFEVQQTEETVTPSRQPLTPDVLNSSGTRLVPYPHNDTYYLVVDLSRLTADRGGSATSEEHIGTYHGSGFAYRFSMQGEDFHEDPPADLRGADHEIVERAVAFPRVREGTVVLAPDADEQLVVATTVAPGTTITVTVSGAVDRTLTRTVRPQNHTVAPGFLVPLDLADVPAGSNLTVQFGDGVALQSSGDGLQGVVRRPEASLEVTDEPLTSQSLAVRSVSVTHPSIVAVYAQDGSLVGTKAVGPGASEDVFVPLAIREADRSTFRVVLYRDTDRSRTLTEADERYRVGGLPVSATVETGGDEPVSETETATSTASATETATSTATVGTAETPTSGTRTTADSAPGFGVLAALLALAGSLLLAVRNPF